MPNPSDDEAIRRRFQPILDSILRSPNLSALDVRLYGVLMSYCSNKGAARSCSVPTVVLARDLSTSERTVTRCARTLMAEGLLDVIDQTSEGKSPKYLLKTGGDVPDTICQIERLGLQWKTQVGAARQEVRNSRKPQEMDSESVVEGADTSVDPPLGGGLTPVSGGADTGVRGGRHPCQGGLTPVSTHSSRCTSGRSTSSKVPKGNAPARSAVAFENAMGGISRCLDAPRASRAEYERAEHEEQHATPQDKDLRAATPEKVSNLITLQDAGPSVGVEVTLSTVDGCAAGEGFVMADETEEQKRAKAERAAGVRKSGPPGGKPIPAFDGPAEPAEKRLRSSMQDPSEPRPPKPPKKERRAAKGPVSSQKPDSDAEAVDHHGVPTSPWGLYCFFKREVLMRWPTARVSPHNGKIMFHAKSLMDSYKDHRSSLCEMVRILVLDFDNFLHARLFLAGGDGKHPTFEQLYANAEMLYRLIGKGVVAPPGARVSAYAEDYRRRIKRTGAQPDVQTAESAPTLSIEDEAELLRAPLRTDGPTGANP